MVIPLVGLLTVVQFETGWGIVEVPPGFQVPKPQILEFGFKLV